MNVGASRPEDAGLYFSWGNVDGVSADDAAAVAAMTEAAYANSPGASINHDLIDATEDAAMAIMGIDWCMPDDEDLQELIDECNWEWVTVNGVNGYRVSSKQPGNTNSIFLPAVGDINNGNLVTVNQRGLYWSSKKYPEGLNRAYELYTDNSEVTSKAGTRAFGRSIRARLA